MSFASLSEFFRMGTHGVYVWTAYGLTLAALIAIHVYVCRSFQVNKDLRIFHL